MIKELPKQPPRKISRLISAEKKIAAPASLTVRAIDDFNEKIRRKEGALLRGSGKFKLERLRKEPTPLRYEKAEGDYNRRLKRAGRFYWSFQSDFQIAPNDSGYLPQTVFRLHEAAKRAYTALILTFTGYKPKLQAWKSPGSRLFPSAMNFCLCFRAAISRKNAFLRS